MMGPGSMIARNAKAEVNLKYLVIVNPGSAINAQRGEDYILVHHRAVPPGRAKMYMVEDIVSALQDRLNGDTYRGEV